MRCLDKWTPRWTVDLPAAAELLASQSGPVPQAARHRIDRAVEQHDELKICGCYAVGVLERA